MKSMLKYFTAVVLSIIIIAAVAVAQVASNGNYTLNQTVVASGGGTSSDGVSNIYKVEGTAGQSAAGTFAAAGSYSIRSGFWSPNPFAPTAAEASISGRVITNEGAGIRNVIVVLMGGSLLTPRTTRTGTFGSFMFEDIAVGQTYTVRVHNKKYGFPQPSQVFSLLDSLTDVVFQAAWEN